jgi:hypothetical protein
MVQCPQDAFPINPVRVAPENMRQSPLAVHARACQRARLVPGWCQPCFSLHEWNGARVPGISQKTFVIVVSDIVVISQ